MSQRQVADAINILAKFLANQQVADLSSITPDSCIVICGSAIFRCFEHVYGQLQRTPLLARTLVLCGGVGHSTSYLYDAIKKSEKYHYLYDAIAGQQNSEAEFMFAVLKDSGALAVLEQAGMKVLVETRSTNCGANAIEADKVMRAAQLPVNTPLFIAQDPTMSLRTRACFEKVYEHVPKSLKPILVCYPTFVPRVKVDAGQLSFDTEAMQTFDVWDMDRFLDLLLGEIPRLRDDSNGYGPRGKGYIPQVDIPEYVENAWSMLRSVHSAKR